MKKILYVFWCGCLCVSLSQAQESNIDSSDITNDTNELSDTPRKYSLYQPIKIKKNSYGSFSIGYSYNEISSSKISLKNNDNSYSKAANGAFFGLERGWQKNNFMIGGYLNGVAGQDYSLTLGARFSYIIAKYIIPSLSIGYGLSHLTLPEDSSQQNLHGLRMGGGIFVNLFRGFGIKFEGIYSYPMGILRGNVARNYGNPTFSGYSLIVTFAFYDFSI